MKILHFLEPYHWRSRVGPAAEAAAQGGGRAGGGGREGGEGRAEGGGRGGEGGQGGGGGRAWRLVLVAQPAPTHHSEEGGRTCSTMREIVHIQAGQCGNQIGAKVTNLSSVIQNS